MIVAELIEFLKTVPQDVEVKYYDGDNGWTDVEPEFRENFPISYYFPPKDDTPTWKGVSL